MFRGLLDEEIDQVGTIAQERNISTGAILFAAGDEPIAFYVLRFGQIRLVPNVRDRLTPNAAAAVRHGADPASARASLILTPGSAFGEVDIIAGKPRIVSAVATQDSTLLVLQASEFNALLSTAPTLAMKITAEATRAYSGMLNQPEWP